jgi:phosphoglycerate dehydrogenase-like enzyme
MRVAVLDDYQRVALQLGAWDELGAAVEVTAFADHVADDDAVVERLKDFEAVVAMRERTPLHRARLERLPRLRLLVTTGMANASIDLDAARERGVVVCGTGGLPSPTAELTWALILGLTRRVAEEDRAIRAGGWQHTIGPELAGRTLGVVGLGRLGARVARIAQAFEMDVLAWSQNLDPARAASLGVQAVARDELLRRADVVTIHLRLSARTRGLIGAAELARMRPDAYLVNTSRGPIVDEAALVAALEDGTIAGAALDVYDTEPLPADHPLRRARNTLLTPHIGYVTTGSYAVYYREAAEDIAAFLRGEPIRTLQVEQSPPPCRPT